MTKELDSNPEPSANRPSPLAEASAKSGIPQDVLAQASLIGQPLRGIPAGNDGQLGELPTQQITNQDLNNPTLYGKGGGGRDR